jgi:hypothetical protein
LQQASKGPPAEQIDSITPQRYTPNLRKELQRVELLHNFVPSPFAGIGSSKIL